MAGLIAICWKASMYEKSLQQDVPSPTPRELACLAGLFFLNRQACADSITEDS